MAIIYYSILSTDITSATEALYFNDHNLEFLLGIVIAQYSNSSRFMIVKPKLFVLFGSIVFFATGINESLINIPISSEQPHYHLMYGVSAALIVAGLIRLKCNLQNYWVGVGAFLGRASYSIYLIHFAVLSAVCKLLVILGLPTWLNMCLLVLSGLTVGSVLYQYVEQPLLNVIRKFVHQRGCLKLLERANESGD